MTELVQHSSKNDRWFSPQHVVDASLAVLGPLDLDPASEVEANKRIGAAKIYTVDDDGLSKDWSGTIFINAPGGKRKGKSLPLLFWEKLMRTRDAGWLRHAIFIGFSIEVLQTSQRRDFPSLCRFPTCIPNKRLSFDMFDGSKAGSPAHANSISYVPGLRCDLTGVFIEEFSKIGEIVGPLC